MLHIMASSDPAINSFKVIWCTFMRHNDRWLLLLLVFFVTFVGCRNSLPANFDSLSMDDKIKVYGKYLDDHINPQDSARLSIAAHGGPAAARMQEYLQKKRTGFPCLEALAVIEAVQETRCSLRGSSVPQALRDFLASKPTSQAEFTFAKVALDEIERETALPPCEIQKGN
jgi:hypothetical protein